MSRVTIGNRLVSPQQSPWLPTDLIARKTLSHSVYYALLFTRYSTTRTPFPFHQALTLSPPTSASTQLFIAITDRLLHTLPPHQLRTVRFRQSPLAHYRKAGPARHR